MVNIHVTSVSKKETDLFTAPAAVYVITKEDIARSSASSIPELLRMVPGLQVAQIDASSWAISARGFNSAYADKLLVLIDGRTVYSEATSGVPWDQIDLPMADLERIEVIRGPGAAVWGTNAVNGVINIITKSAKDTQGGLAAVTYGTEDQPRTTVQYGGQLATNLFYRAYVTYFNRRHFRRISTAKTRRMTGTRFAEVCAWIGSRPRKTISRCREIITTPNAGEERYSRDNVDAPLIL